MNLKKCFDFICERLNLKTFTEECPKTNRTYGISRYCSHTPEEFEILKQAVNLDPSYSPQTKIEFLKLEYAKSKESSEKDMLLFSFYYHSNFYIGNQRSLAYPEPIPETLKFATYDRQVVWYPNGNVWNFPGNKSQKSYPCSLKDFFYYQKKSNVAYQPYLLLFQFLGETYPIFKDLASDFEQGSAYTSIPIIELYSCGSRRALLEKYYGITGMKRNNRECIGDGIFLHRAKRLVPEEHLQKIYGFHCFPTFIGRKKTDMVDPITYFLHVKFTQNFPNMKIKIKNPYFAYEENAPMKIDFEITKSFICDAVSMAISMDVKIPLSWKSLVTFKDWHDMLAIRSRNRKLPTVSIPKESKFRKLKMPEGCVRLTSRKQFVEESTVNNNCVSTYIPAVNQDRCSIWSMRKPDGRRFTIEIRCRTSKEYPNGYFYIGQMLGYDNMKVPDDDYKKIRNCLEKQMKK